MAKKKSIPTNSKKNNNRKVLVPLREAKEQVHLAMIRSALLHLAFSRTLVREFGQGKGKEIILKSIMEYGQLIGERIKNGKPDLPFYGVHDWYIYKDQKYFDRRREKSSQKDYSLYKVYGCSFAKIFNEYDAKDLGCLYCYVDAAKSMGTNPDYKLVHRNCALCESDFCSFALTPTTSKEKSDFLRKRVNWRKVDSLLMKGANIGKRT